MNDDFLRDEVLEAEKAGKYLPLQFDLEDLLKRKLILTKSDVGERQLNEAIRMFFDDRDPVALHTVTGAAHGIIRDLGLAAGIKKSVKDSPLIKEEKRGDYIKAVNFAQSFFKHADWDPEGKLVFSPDGTPLMILEAILIWVSLKQDLSHEMQVFVIWAELRFPGLLNLDSKHERYARLRTKLETPASFKSVAQDLLRGHGPGLDHLKDFC